MKQAPLNREVFETIEAYVLDRMKPTDRIAFEGRLERDRDLRDEVELQRENIHAIELGGFMRSVKEIVSEQKEHELSRGSSYRWIGYAASIAIIISVAIWWSVRPPAHERLFTEHFRPDPGLPVTMGITDDPAFSEAMILYKEERFQEARTEWTSLLQAEPSNDTLLFYNGISALAASDPSAAIEPLRSVATNDRSIFHERANWYLFLAHVRLGDVEAARENLQTLHAEHAAQAQAILNELGD